MKPPASCTDEFDPHSLSVAEALARIHTALQPLRDRERVALAAALNRSTARDVYSPVNVPAHRNSAMDGYALAGADLPATGTAQLRVVGTAWAGAPWPGALTRGECVRIMTGAVVPQGADTVVMQEHAARDGDSLTIASGARPGQHVRHPGEDLRAGALVLPAGTRLRPAELGVLASLGLADVDVIRRLRVAFFTTGDELRHVGEPLAAGEVYDSNRYTIAAMLQRLDVDVIDLGIVRDDRAALEAAFTRAAASADALITSGGVSVGEADFVRETLARIGQVDFWKIAMKPGRPLAFGRVNDSVFFGLPGNPVSVMATFYQFVQPALRRLMGETASAPLSVQIPCAAPLKKAPGRTEYQRGIASRDAAGHVSVVSTGAQGSGMLSSMSKANCFIVLPPATVSVEPGALVDVQLFEGLV